MADTQFVVARIGRPHGLHGEVTVQLHTDDPQSRLVPGATFATQAAPGSGVPKTLTLRSTRVHNGVWLLGFEQVPDRTGAESLRGTRLMADGDALRAADEGDDDEGWYEDDLVGLAVVTREGAAIGRVAALQTGTAQDLLVVELTGGTTAYLPFVEAIVPEVDLDAGQIVVDPPEGLLDLNA